MIKYAVDEPSSIFGAPRPHPAMARTRSKSAPRLTRDAERLIALANGLHTSGSLTEDRFWEAEIASLVDKLLEHGNDPPVDGALERGLGLPRAQCQPPRRRYRRRRE